MKTIIFGPRGFLGSAFAQAIPNAISVQTNICDRQALSNVLDYYQPDIVVNCAGKTGLPNIDWCETNKLETLQANTTGPLVLLGECMARGVYLVHIGSGCIFEGDNEGGGFTEEDAPNYHGSYYSRTKIIADSVLSEFPVLILRLRMPIDNRVHRRNLLCRLPTYDRVLDVQNSFTYVPDFIDSACHLIRKRMTGIFHIVNPGTVSPYEIMIRYKAIVDSTHSFERLTLNDLGDLVSTGRSNCQLSTEKLESVGLKLQPIETALDSALRSISARFIPQE